MNPASPAKRQCVKRQAEATEDRDLDRSQRACLAADLHLEGELGETLSVAMAAAATSGRWISYKRILKRMATKWRRASDTFVGLERVLTCGLKLTEGLTEGPEHQRKLQKNLCRAMLAPPRPSVDPRSIMCLPSEMAAYLRLRSYLMDLLVASRPGNPGLSHAIEVLGNELVFLQDQSSKSDLTGRLDLFEAVKSRLREGPKGARKFAELKNLHYLILITNPTYISIEAKYLDVVTRLYAEFPQLPVS